ncbi:MAG: T9SS type A sorting domain-containing protein [Flavobacterium sp.]|uniref:T9SS type A sorting domain-containing protein n=1 Tax=Flavobacterium sp. TaxID=239 RepID=UPI003BE1B5E2
MKLAAIIVLITINISYSQVVLNANGPGNTYERITNFFAPGNGTGAVEAPDETPDGSHQDFGRHIAEVFDTDLNKYVFEFYSHYALDNDVATLSTDRQRIEIKTYAASPDNLKGTLGETVIYKWRFRLPTGFQPSGNFTHIHQVKGVNGDDDSPIFTLTPRLGTPNKLELIYVANSTSGTDKLNIVDLLPFEGNWIEAEEIIQVGSSGSYSITLKKHSDGTILLSYSNATMATIRPDNSFIRPKWGIYRSLNDVVNLRDEAVRFSDFSIEEVNLNTTAIQNEKQIASLPNPVHDKLEISNKIMQQFDKLRLFDITGKLLLEKGNLLNEIDVSFLKTGMYFIRFSNKQNQSVSIKIIKT